MITRNYFYAGSCGQSTFSGVVSAKSWFPIPAKVLQIARSDILRVAMGRHTSYESIMVTITAFNRV